MQSIICYLRADSVNAVLVDEYNQPISRLPAVMRGMKAILILRLLTAEGTPYPKAELNNYTAWDFVLAHDWDMGTSPQVRVTTGIEVVTNTECTEIRIPLTELNTVELIAALSNASDITLGAELAGFEVGETTPVFLLQFNVSVRNRRGGAGCGTPTQVPDGSYTAAQVDALLAGVSGGTMSVEFSANGSVWSGDSAGAYFWRFRISETAAWSAAIPIPQPAAVAGAVAYSFTVAAGSTATQQAITWSQLGTAGKTPVRLYQVQSDNSELDITANSRLQIVLNASGVTLFWANDAFPAGNYIIRG